jgi:hypothetical protein
MYDYFRSLAEFEARFATEQSGRDYLAKLRWPGGFTCPKCGHAGGWPVRTLFECARCGRQTSVTAGTIFQDTRKPLTTWFRAMWWVTSKKTGTGALSLQKILGLGSYETAWAWLHKLRRAMVSPGRDRRVGSVEIDETYRGATGDNTELPENNSRSACEKPSIGSRNSNKSEEKYPPGIPSPSPPEKTWSSSNQSVNS